MEPIHTIPPEDERSYVAPQQDAVPSSPPKTSLSLVILITLFFLSTIGMIGYSFYQKQHHTPVTIENPIPSDMLLSEQKDIGSPASALTSAIRQAATQEAVKMASKSATSSGSTHLRK